MTKTRRQTKATTGGDTDDGGHATEDIQHLTINMPDDVDLEALSELLPDTNITSPTVDVIVTLYRRILAQASEVNDFQRELDEARAEVEKKDVELDQALQDRESMSKELEASLETVQDELKHMKQERDELVASKAALEAQITALSNSQSSSSTNLETLKHRVDDTEREKRDLVGVISRLKQESTQREEEIQTLRANLKEARHEHQNLEAQVRELRSTETSTKFKLDSLTQQLQLSQAEAERSNTELVTKTEEFAKHRRAKHAELTNLQTTYDSLSQTHASTQASLKALQSAHSAQSHQLTQALARVQDLTGQLAEQEATYASEASGLRRLVGMMEEREKQAKSIVEDIEKEWAGVGERAERREAALRDEVERERKGREGAEKRAEQLENVLDRMGRGELPTPGRGNPGTPSGVHTPLRTPGVMSSLDDGMMTLSPTVAMASKAQKAGKTFTQVYADYVRLQEDFAKKSAEYDHMDRTLSAVLAQIEERAPILSQQRAEYERLQSEASQLASQLAQALSDRDGQAHLAQETSQKLAKSSHENTLLQTQLDDLGRQVQSLLREISRRDDPTIPLDEDLQGIAPAEDTESVITNNLVLFKSIGGLQEQNQKLLKIVRELGRKMESEERDYRDTMEKEQGEAVREAHEAMQELAAQLDRQKKSSEVVIQAYVKERDALRAMLARVEKAGGSAMLNEANGLESHASGANNDMASELAEVQSQFDAYRNEMGVDATRLREDLVAAQREASQLGAALAKSNARIEYLTDRHRMSQEQFAIQARELDDMNKRNQQLYDQWTRIDIECSRATEDLQVANGRIEQYRNECANLRAEKKIWESVQVRLVEENKTLAMERSHLSDLMSNVQRMHNDLERSGENDRRRLENQLQMLESQTQDLRTQLSQERDTVRHMSLQKDIQLKELQNRLDRAIQDLSKTRESLVGADTSKKHLEERVEELSKQLQGNEQKLAVYERRPSAAGQVTQNIDPDMSREQQMEAEVAELRSKLKMAEVDLATARSHVQQFQEISQANEEALAAMNATYDDYKQSTEAQIARRESEFKALQEKLQAAQEELTLVKTNHADLQKTYESERAAWTNDKKQLEDTIVDMSTSEKHSESDRSSREHEVRQQEERAKAAEERYSHEVVAHAESIKAIENLKQQLSNSQAAARDNLTAAETAKSNLAASEGSWKQQKAALDKEVSDLNARCQDLSSQNNILHQHLESVSTQAARIRQAADSSVAQAGEGEGAEDSDAKLSELRAVVAYLRKEKEIVDLQLELSKQENVRLKAQIDHLSQSLDDTRKTLSEEREKAVETATSAAQHAELLERINQLNILRESNATLRTDCERHAKKSRELEVQLKTLSEQLDPAKEQARVAQAELQACAVQVRRLEEENRRWQERNTQLLSKYDRIDPAELQALKDEIQVLQSQQAEFENKKAEFEEATEAQNKAAAEQQERIVALETALRTYKETHAKNNQGFRARVGELNNRISALGNEKKDAVERCATLETEIAGLRAAKEDLDATTSSSNTLSIEEVAKQASIIVGLREERDKLLAEKASWASTASIDNGSVASDISRGWETEKADLIKARDEALAHVKTATEQAQKTMNDMKSIRFQNEKFQARITELLKSKANETERQAAVVSAAVEKAKSEVQNPNGNVPEDVAKRHADELRSLEEQLTAKHQQQLKEALDAVEKEKTVPANGVDHKAAIEAAIAEHEKQAEARHAEEIAAAVERGRLESGAKGKLKDAQLVRAQKKVKELEAQIQQWRNAGVIPEQPVPSTSAVPGPSGLNQTPAKVNVPATTAQTPATSAAATATSGASTPTNSLPRKPPVGTPTGPATGVGRGAANVVRGAMRGRGGAAGAGAPGRAMPVKPAAAAAGGVSIIGAAGKRPRESEGTSPTDDSLAKRLKPAETPTTPAAPTGGKPVTLRRPPPAP